MIRKFVVGSPLETYAVVEKQTAQTGEIPYLKMEDNGIKLSMQMDTDAVVYGLGEQVRGINKRGWIYVSDNADDPNHTEGKHSLYGAHNFLLIDGKVTFGLFLDTPGKVSFDIGYTSYDQMVITFENPDYDCYVIEADMRDENVGQALQIVHEFRGLIGRSYIPPKWAFGFGQSRWGYKNAADVREIVKQYREHNIPLDSVYMDIDYMDHFKDFTIDGQAFPDFPEFVSEMKKEHIHLVPIIDAGVKIEKGFPVYEEGMANGYFCKGEDGKPFTAAVWPGKVHFPDVLHEEVRQWFGNWYKVLLNQGIEGFWNDMNEPAIFYSAQHLKEVFEQLEDYRDKELDIWSFFELKNLIGGIDNRAEDYASFYHMYNGQKIRHDLVHNLYGYNMTKAAGEAFERLSPEKRILLFSRASYIGMHRYGGIWTGDNQSWWSHIALSMKQMTGLNMCGFLYSGSDIGGFGSDCTPDLLLRWLEFGIFTPLMRNHAALGTRSQEAFRFDRKEAADIIGLRYMLLPYIYSEYVKAAVNGEMYFRPIAFDYPEDARARHIEDQLCVGESIMIAPVCEQNAAGRNVYLPERMKMYRFRSMTDFDTKVLVEGDHYLPVNLHEVLIFVKPEHIVPIVTGHIMNVAEEPSFADQCKVLSFVEKGSASYRWYDDDGYTRNYDMEKRVRTVTVDNAGKVTVR